MPPKLRQNTISLRANLARGILSDAEMKACGRTSRIDKITTLVAMAALLVGFLLAANSTTHTTGWIVFFGGFGTLLGVGAMGFLPAVRRMQDRLARCGYEAAGEMRLPEVLMVRWAINELARQPLRPQG